MTDELIDYNPDILGGTPVFWWGPGFPCGSGSIAIVWAIPDAGFTALRAERIRTASSSASIAERPLAELQPQSM